MTGCRRGPPRRSSRRCSSRRARCRCRCLICGGSSGPAGSGSSRRPSGLVGSTRWCSRRSPTTRQTRSSTRRSPSTGRSGSRSGGRCRPAARRPIWVLDSCGAVSSRTGARHGACHHGVGPVRRRAGPADTSDHGMRVDEVNDAAGAAAFARVTAEGWVATPEPPHTTRRTLGRGRTGDASRTDLHTRGTLGPESPHGPSDPSNWTPPSTRRTLATGLAHRPGATSTLHRRARSANSGPSLLPASWPASFRPPRSVGQLHARSPVTPALLVPLELGDNMVSLAAQPVLTSGSSYGRLGHPGDGYTSTPTMASFAASPVARWCGPLYSTTRHLGARRGRELLAGRISPETIGRHARARLVPFLYVAPRV